ncbi:hypothetical protein Pfo_022204 [Paulownia fortunei]|nr:hypothetical protein Pfo_022204 [Paulownia fortunei]
MGSKTWLALLVPIFAVFARFSSGHGAFLISITLSVLLILLSTLFLFTFSKQKPIMVDNSLLKEAPTRAENEFSPQEKHQRAVQENALISSADCPCDDLGEVQAENETTAQKKAAVEDNGQGFLIRSQDLYSESESMDQSSSTSSEDHFSDIEWPYNIGQRLDCSDDSISDEESLIEIAIPSGQFVSPDKDPMFNLKCCKLSADLSHQESMFQKDFLADINEMNEEDNLIEIDIYMGSIKCSSFDI